MKCPELELHRRALLAASLGAGFFSIPLFGTAASLTGADISVLNTPAVKVKALTGIFLVAITHAGDRLVAVGEHGVVIYSDDAGSTWTQADVPVNATLTCVAFATPSLGWAAGHFGVILNTIDGGKTWAVQLNGLQVNELALASAQDAAVQASASPANTSPALALAMKRAKLFMANGPDKPFLSMVLLGPQKIMVFGAYRMAMLTTDGGKTWLDWNLHVYDRLSRDLYDAALIGSDIYIAAETGLVFRSTDGGNTFPQVASPSQVTLFGVLGAHDGSVLVYGVAGNCFRSTNGGQVWMAINLGTEDNLIAGRVLRSGAIVIARESGGLFISHDNGKHAGERSDAQSLDGLSRIQRAVDVHDLGAPGRNLEAQCARDARRIQQGVQGQSSRILRRPLEPECSKAGEFLRPRECRIDGQGACRQSVLPRVAAHRPKVAGSQEGRDVIPPIRHELHPKSGETGASTHRFRIDAGLVEFEHRRVVDDLPGLSVDDLVEPDRLGEASTHMKELQPKCQPGVGP